MYGFTIPGEPKGKARPIVTKRGVAFTPQRTVLYENLVKMEYERQVGDSLDGRLLFPKGEPIRMCIDAYFAIPKSASKAMRQKMEFGSICPTKKPDMDNIVKAIADALNGVAYYDDSQIVVLTIRKWYSETPRVHVELEAV